jgi:perosamine synthetase
MFSLKKSLGDHYIYRYDTDKHKFKEFFEKLYATTELNKLHLISNEYSKEGLSDIETELHKKFYNEIKTNNEFKKLYCNLIKDIYSNFFPDENQIIYQSFPSIRLQFINNITVPPHYDSDEIGCHPIGEKNFLLPITEMVRSKRLFIESKPGKKDFEGVDLEYGDLFYFNGNKCTHYNEINKEDTIRISLDFRIILAEDYKKYIESGSITTTNPRDPDKKRIPTKMLVGGYYQLSYNIDTLDEMMNWHLQRDMIIQTRPSFDEKEAEACYNYMKGDNFVTEFIKTEELEKMICEYTKSKHCIMTVNGNVALIIALMALDIKAGDDIIVPNYTMIASINSIKAVGANPIIVDVDPDTLTVSLDIIKANITPNTKGLMHVSLNNRHKDIDIIASYCKENNVYLIEDAAQSLGCFVESKHFGTFGDIGCFSLSTPKIISTGQGGFLITNNADLASKIRMIKNFGRKTGGIDVFEVFGINYKFTDIQAVIGIEQMKKLPNRVIRLRQIFDLYKKYLNDLHCKTIDPQSDEWIPWFIDIFVNKRDELMNFLKIHNIQTRATYPEINKTPMYYSDITYPISNSVSNNGLFLPSHILLTNEQIIYICKIINLFYELY